LGENGLMEADTTVDFTKLVAMNIESKYMKLQSVFLHENVLEFFTRFFCPGFFAQAPVFGMVSLPSV
jgi:hypothetical protein